MTKTFPVIRKNVSEYLATSNDGDKIPTSREDLVEEFMIIESVKNIVGDNNSKDTGNMTNNVTKDLIQDLVIHIPNLRPFNYDEERTDPVAVAQQNAQEFAVEEVLAYRGDRTKRST